MLVITAILFAIYALVARALDRWSISGPMVFLIAGALLGPSFIGALPSSPNSDFTKTLAEITLAILLFADASTISLSMDSRVVRSRHGTVVRSRRIREGTQASYKRDPSRAAAVCPSGEIGCRRFSRRP